MNHRRGKLSAEDSKERDEIIGSELVELYALVRSRSEVHHLVFAAEYCAALALSTGDTAGLGLLAESLETLAFVDGIELEEALFFSVDYLTDRRA